MEKLNDIPPTEFCRRLDQEKSIQQGHSTRVKTRTLKKVSDVFDILSKLGYNVTLKAKKQ
jgi:hypothetical protein